jgi:enamine deaminase RidA (YjgF/YER057c/UK114 family)
VAEETSDLFRRFEDDLEGLGLSLENTGRTRLWCRDRETRNLAAATRFKILANTKASSSSYVSPQHLASGAKVALDLLAMRPSRAGAERKPVEFEPPRAYLRYLRFDSIVFFSGYTSHADTLEVQVPQVLAAIDGSLAAAGIDWTKVVKLSAFLHRSQRLDLLKSLLIAGNRLDMSKVEFGFVDGYAGEKNLLEVETTATSA